MKTSIAFYCCSNGYGHFKRITEISKVLSLVADITIFCTKKQMRRIGTIPGVHYIVTTDNIRWDLKEIETLDIAYERYLHWLNTYGPLAKNYDVVISDNLPGILAYRADTILMGSFFWKDVFQSTFGDNKLSILDAGLLEEYNPILITNKYVETQSVKEYTNKLQFGFGCKSRKEDIFDIKTNLVNYSSLNYMDSYYDYVTKLRKDYKLIVTDSFEITSNARMFARPGVGTITHCVENSIPLIALYDENDSQEIIELAQVVEDLQLGFKQDVNKPFEFSKFSSMRTNSSVLEGKKLEINAYEAIANYLISNYGT